MRNVADEKVIKMVFMALCQPILTYCIAVWGGTCKSNLIKLESSAVLKVNQSLPFLYTTKDL